MRKDGVYSLNRRGFSIAASCAVAGIGVPRSALARTADEPDTVPLKDIAAARGIVFGSEIGGSGAGRTDTAFANSGYRALVARECAIVVPENEMKFFAVHRPGDAFDFAAGDRIAAFAQTAGLKLRGHTLLYNRDEFVPPWAAARLETMSASQVGAFLEDHVARVTDHFGRRISSWDVVNETVDPATMGLRQTVYTRKLGFDCLRIAYETAKRHAPGAQRVYNDYMSWGAGGAKHRQGVLRLLAEFRAKNVPVDALGIQGHLSGTDALDAPQLLEWRHFIDEVVGMGYEILITELDVNDKDLPRDITARDQAVYAVTRAFLDLMLSYRQLRQLLCWGLVDRYSWLSGFAPRADGSPQRGTPYDSALHPKPMRRAIAEALKSAPER